MKDRDARLRELASCYALVCVGCGRETKVPDVDAFDGGRGACQHCGRIFERADYKGQAVEVVLRKGPPRSTYFRRKPRAQPPASAQLDAFGGPPAPRRRDALREG